MYRYIFLKLHMNFYKLEIYLHKKSNSVKMKKKNNPILVQTVTLSELSNFLGKPLSPYILELSELSESAFVKTWQPINLSSFRHFGYAVQWFGLAIVLIVGYVFFLRKGETKGNE